MNFRSSTVLVKGRNYYRHTLNSLREYERTKTKTSCSY